MWGGGGAIQALLCSVSSAKCLLGLLYRPIIYRLILCLDDGDEKLQKLWQYSDNGSGLRPDMHPAPQT